MNIHFSTDIIINGKPEVYNVIFEQDAYRFIPESGSGEPFLLKREDDEWHAEGAIMTLQRHKPFQLWISFYCHSINICHTNVVDC